MITYRDLAQGKKAFIFELDNVLYPEKDYLLQVYYLFAHLLEYTETVPPADDLTAFFKKVYEHHGKDGIFERAAAAFGIDDKYRENFKRIHVNAQLPLKLLLFDEVKSLLSEIIKDGKKIFVLTKGNPLMQLNKLKQIDWSSLGKQVTVYFYDELVLQGIKEPLTYLLHHHNFTLQEALVIDRQMQPDDEVFNGEVDYLSIDTLLKKGYSL